jgi:hypothetical protein
MTDSWFPLMILFRSYWVRWMLNFLSYSERMFQLVTRLKVLVDVESYFRAGETFEEMWVMILWISMPLRISF